MKPWQMMRRFGQAAGGGSVLKTNLLHWWSLDETSGNRADSHGSLAMVPAGTVSAVSALVGNGSSTPSSVSNYLGTTTSDDLSATDFTIAGVFKTSNASYGIINRNNKASASADRQWLVLIEGGAFYLSVSTDGTGSTAFAGSGTGLGNGALHTFFAWRDRTANTINVQVDGGTVASTSLSGATNLYNSTDPGYSMHIVGNVYPGGVNDEIAIWNRVLTSDERAWIHNSGAWRSYADLDSYVP